MSKKPARDAMAELKQKFGHPDIEWFGTGSYRVWVHGWHIHTLREASYGSFCADGKTPDDAAKNLLKNARRSRVSTGNSCEESCPNYVFHF